jgi:hypothetical protein
MGSLGDGASPGPPAAASSLISPGEGVSARGGPSSAFFSGSSSSMEGLFMLLMLLMRLASWSPFWLYSTHFHAHHAAVSVPLD